MALAQPDTLVRSPVAATARPGSDTTLAPAGQAPVAVADFLSLLGTLSAAPAVAAPALPALPTTPESTVQSEELASEALTAADPAALQASMAQWLAALQSPVAAPLPLPPPSPSSSAPAPAAAPAVQAAPAPGLLAGLATAPLPALLPAPAATATATASADAPASSLQDSAWAGLLKAGSEPLGQDADQGGRGQGEGGDASQGRQALLAGLGLTALPAADAGALPAFPAALQAQSLTTAPAPTSIAAPDALLQPRLHETVGGEGWARELGARLTLMAAKGDQSGSLRLSPEHLGPLEVQITVTDEQVSVQFGATHADTRAALQEALPRLRELFAGAGLQLSDAGVSRETPRQTPPTQAARTGSGSASTDATAVNLDLRGQPTVRHLGVLDTYA